MKAISGLLLSIFIFAMSLSCPRLALSFPDLIRHNYVSCRTCHVAPSGGGVLTDYGRALSAELVSTWGSEREAQIFHGASASDKKPEWLIVGGQARVLQLHKETPTVQRGSTIPMQFEIDLGIRKNEWTFVSSFFKIDALERRVKPSLVRAYGMYQNDEGFSARLGKFAPHFGILVPYHTLATRDSLGFGRESEREMGEIGWLKDSWEVSMGLGQESKVGSKDRTNNSFAVGQINWSFYDSGRLGAGYFNNSDRNMLSLQGLFGFRERFTYLSEFVFLETKSHKTRGIAHFSQFLWEQEKGVVWYLIEDYLKADLNDDFTLSNSYGLGLRLNPRPHFDFDLSALQKRVVAAADRYDSVFWFQSHYYF